MAKRQGPNAFPQAQIAGADLPVDLAEHGGMTLRDYFAAKAMQGLVVNREQTADQVAAWAYNYADAMLAERSK